MRSTQASRSGTSLAYEKPTRKTTTPRKKKKKKTKKKLRKALKYWTD